MNGEPIKYHLKEAGHELTLCNFQSLGSGHWSKTTNKPPELHTVCKYCSGLAESMISSTGIYDPRLELIIRGMGHVHKEAAAPVRNCSPFVMLEEINAASASILEKIDNEEDMTEDLEKFRATLKKSKGWIMNELFPATCCLPYNMGDK